MRLRKIISHLSRICEIYIFLNDIKAEGILLGESKGTGGIAWRRVDNGENNVINETHIHV
jgi:hypothetical protein